MSTRYTLAEAQALLPEARRRVGEAATAIAELRRLMGQARQGIGPSGSDADVAALEAAAEAALAWFAERDVQVKSLRPALLDFPARAVRGGQAVEVLLCWRDDEDAIAYYHPAATGYRGREPVGWLDEV